MYLAAFASVAVQIHGLIGANGILPAREYLDGVAGLLGPSRFWWLPTLLWVDPSDGMLTALCGAGIALSIVLMLGLAPVFCLVGLWALYLSITTVGQDFFSFQWDILLLETGFLSIFLAPLALRSRRVGDAGPRREIVWLLRWLLFRLMFSSGMVKILSGDPTWSTFSALDFHYWTQPLPTWIGWYAAQLPHTIQLWSCGLMFAIELGVPMLVWGGRRARAFAAGAFLLLQVLIALTGNYGFFNLLTAALCVMLLDDASWPARFVRGHDGSPGASREWPRPVVIAVGSLLLVLSVFQTFSAARFGVPWPEPVMAFRRTLAPLRLVGSYGLFAVMTTKRQEIVVEGSEDGQTWQAYQFRWKPDDVAHTPPFVAPHQPRVDWQMWFAALGTYEQSPWFLALCERLLRGSPEVTALLAHDPFAGHPPKLVRATLYEYRFTTLDERRTTGNWWAREDRGIYLPPVSAESLQRN